MLLTKQELADLQAKKANDNVVKVQQVLIEGAYIKGYGPDHAGVMDAEHRPLFNITKLDLKWLYANNLIKVQDNKYVRATDPVKDHQES